MLTALVAYWRGLNFRRSLFRTAIRDGNDKGTTN